MIFVIYLFSITFHFLNANEIILSSYNYTYGQFEYNTKIVFQGFIPTRNYTIKVCVCYDVQCTNIFNPYCGYTSDRWKAEFYTPEEPLFYRIDNIQDYDIYVCYMINKVYIKIPSTMNNFTSTDIHNIIIIVVAFVIALLIGVICAISIPTLGVKMCEKCMT